MKLTAAILFAVTNAQREGGRQREKETPSSSDDAFAAYFGAGFDYNGDYGAAFDADAFGESAETNDYDAFGDLSFGDYTYPDSVDAAAVEEAVAADEANRPGNDDNDDGKTLIPGNTQATNDRTDSGFDAYCYENSASSLDDWATTTAGTTAAGATGTGKWRQCIGEGSACEVKVVRDLTSNDIVQVVSKCANEVSCVANMKQNFNPGSTGSNNVYQWYVQQACKPWRTVDGSGNDTGPMIGGRFSSNKERSTCFFCVEPCTGAETPTLPSTLMSATSNCVGPTAEGTADGAPANAVDGANNAINIFDHTKLAAIPSATNQFTTDNYYTTVTGVYTGTTAPLTVSRIQAVQLDTNFTG